jgi:branched-subunit amino acid aminotransferase/4-amino-4-deoxychorismate lyase
MLELVTDSLVDLFSSGARHGRGVFETIRIEEGRARFLRLHLERLGRGAAFLCMDEPPGLDETRRFLEEKMALSRIELGTLRLLAVDDRLVVSATASIPSFVERADVAAAASIVRLSSSPLNRFKTLSRLENELLCREAADRGLFEVVALNERGLLTDCGRTNVFLVARGRVVTPAADDGALPGVARRVLLEEGLAAEAHLDANDLDSCDAAFLVNALRGIIPIRSFGDHALDTADPAIQAAREALERVAKAT